MALNVPAGSASAPPGPPSNEAKADGTARSSASPRPERTATLHGRRPSPPRRVLTAVAGVMLLLGIAGTLLVARRSRTAAAPPSRPAEAESGVAQLAVDLEHPLKSVTLRIWVDGELAKEERVAGHITKKVIGFTLRKGVWHDVIEVKPGRHDIQVQVAWDDGERTQRISGAFKPESTRRLDVSLGRLVKDLTLEWR